MPCAPPLHTIEMSFCRESTPSLPSIHYEVSRAAKWFPVPPSWQREGDFIRVALPPKFHYFLSTGRNVHMVQPGSARLVRWKVV